MRGPRRGRVFYLGMVNTCAYGERVGESLQVWAAAHKMVALVGALRLAGARAWLVSAPVLGRDARHAHAPTLRLHAGRVPMLFMPVVRHPLGRKLFALIGFAAFCARTVRRDDRVVLYNHAVEYLFGAIILALKGNRPFLDVEDAPRFDERDGRGRLGRVSFRLLAPWVRAEKLIVSRALAERLGLSRYCVVHGVSPAPLPPHLAAAQDPVFRIHYGGTLEAATGVDLFIAAVQRLTARLPHAPQRIEFVVTGFGVAEVMDALARACTGGGVGLSFHPGITPAEYGALLQRCHAGLSLRLPESELSLTTFPSKVVEIAAHGLLLIATRVSDVPQLFDEECALLLPAATPEALCEGILAMLADPARRRRLARAGQARARQRFDARRVGERVAAFLWQEAAATPAVVES